MPSSWAICCWVIFGHPSNRVQNVLYRVAEGRCRQAGSLALLLIVLKILRTLVYPQIYRVFGSSSDDPTRPSTSLRGKSSMQQKLWPIAFPFLSKNFSINSNRWRLPVSLWHSFVVYFIFYPRLSKIYNLDSELTVTIKTSRMVPSGFMADLVLGSP